LRFKRPIYRILFFAAWLAVLGGLATLVIAANRKTGSRTCKGVAVSINGDGETIFVQKSDVLKAIERTAKGPVVKKHFGDMNLGAIEKSLEANPWIRDAELYLDTKDILHVSVWEREPFARVFNTAGASFYIDSSGYVLPLLENYSAKLPVVTGFTAAKKLSAKDSVTLQGLKEIILAVSKDSFWNAQVGQIDITPEHKFELIPLIGSQVIKFGYAENIKDKLNNLLVFYKQVMAKAGLAKYSALDLQYEGQIVAVRRGQTSTVDSVQLQKNIEELMKKKEAEQEPDDALPAIPWVSEQPATINDSLTEPPLEPVTNSPVPEKHSIKITNPRKSQVQKQKPVNAGIQKQVKEPIKKEAPKAVMPSKHNEY
jgi:cell division protein FtsQ